MKHKSTSVSRGSDRRAARTVETIGSALYSLLVKRRYDRIRVGDIVRVARISRATYYRHFPTKDALLGARFAEVLRRTVTFRGPTLVETDLTRFFEHVRQSSRVWGALMSGSVRHHAEPILRRCLEDHLSKACTAETPGMRDLLARYSAATALTVLAWWVDRNFAASPTELQDIYAWLLRGGPSMPGGQAP